MQQELLVNQCSALYRVLSVDTLKDESAAERLKHDGCARRIAMPNTDFTSRKSLQRLSAFVDQVRRKRVY